MRPAAEIEPFALLVDGKILVAGDGIDQLALESLALLFEKVERLVARPDLTHNWAVARDDLAHLLLDRRQILRREGLAAIEVVIEAVLDDRADRHLRAGKKLLHRFGEHMRA